MEIASALLVGLFLLIIVLIVLFIIYLFRPRRDKEKRVSEDIRKIKEQIKGTKGKKDTVKLVVYPS